MKNEGRRRRIKGKNGNGLRCNRSKDELHFNDNVRNKERERERKEYVTGKRERRETEESIENLISSPSRREGTKGNEGRRRKKKENRVRVSEFASVKEQAYEGEGRKAKSEADLRAVEKSSLFLSLFFFVLPLPTSSSTKREAVF